MFSKSSICTRTTPRISYVFEKDSNFLGEKIGFSITKKFGFSITKKSDFREKKGFSKKKSGFRFPHNVS